MSSILRPLAVIGGLILVAGVLSLYRHALGSASRWRLRGQASGGDRRAAAALRLSDDLERFDATARLGTTLAVMIAGVYAGAWVTGFLEPARGEAGGLAKLAAGGALFGLALAILLLGDLLPRRLAAHRPARIASRAGPADVGLRAAGKSRGRLAEPNGRLPGPVARDPAGGRPAITHEEIKRLLQEGVKTGVFEEAEHEIFKRAFRFLDRRARALMTPRGKVVWIDLADSPDEIRRKVIGSPHSRFPVCDQSLDNLLGIIQVKDLLAQKLGGAAVPGQGAAHLACVHLRGNPGAADPRDPQEVVHPHRRGAR